MCVNHLAAGVKLSPDTSVNLQSIIFQFNKWPGGNEEQEKEPRDGGKSHRDLTQDT